jgi:hypothetical protein
MQMKRRGPVEADAAPSGLDRLEMDRIGRQCRRPDPWAERRPTQDTNRAMQAGESRLPIVSFGHVDDLDRQVGRGDAVPPGRRPCCEREHVDSVRPEPAKKRNGTAVGCTALGVGRAGQDHEKLHRTPRRPAAATIESVLRMRSAIDRARR